MVGVTCSMTLHFNTSDLLFIPIFQTWADAFANVLQPGHLINHAGSIIQAAYERPQVGHYGVDMPRLHRRCKGQL